jgi:hypothetical protein
MNQQRDVAGRPFFDVTFPGGEARLTAVDAGESRLGVEVIRLETRMGDGDFGSAIELPVHSIADVMAAALNLVAVAASMPAGTSVRAVRRTSPSSLAVEISKLEGYLPRDLSLQPSPPSHLVYWSNLGPHRLLRVTFVGVQVMRVDPVAPPASLHHVALKLEPVDPENPLELHHFTFFDPDGMAGDYFSFFAADLEVEAVGLT